MIYIRARSVLLICICMVSMMYGQDEPGKVTHTYALKNVNITTRPGIVIPNATLVIKDGLIHGVGQGVSIPADAQVMESDSMYVYAGFIDGLSHTGVAKSEEKEEEKVKDPGNPTNERAGVTPERRVRDYLDPAEKSIESLRKEGFTAVHAVPHGKMLPGQGSIIFLNGDKTKEMVYMDGVSTFGQLKGAGGVFPNTVIAVMTKWRELYKQAQQASVHMAAYQRAPSGMARPTYDNATMAMIPVTKRQSDVFFLAEDHLSAHRAMTLQKDLGFKMVLTGLQNGWRLVDDIKAANVPVLISLELPKETKEEKDKSKESDDKWAKEKEELKKRKEKESADRESQAATFAKAGIAFGFTTEGVSAKDIRPHLARMIKKGLSEDAALAALTVNPARILGVQQLLGTVEKGKIANLVVSDKPFFAEKSNIRMVFVDGQPYEYEVKVKKSSGELTKEAIAKAVGTWTYTIDAGGMIMKGEINIEEEEGELTGTMKGDQIETAEELNDIAIDGDEISFSATIAGQFEVEINGKLSDDEMEGKVKAGDFGTFEITATRSSKPE